MKPLLLILTLLTLLSAQLQSQELPSLPMEADLGKSLSLLAQEHPLAELSVRNDGYPDAAALCLGEKNAPFLYLFGGSQSYDLQAAAETYGDELKCCGFLTTVDALFPRQPDPLPFSDFFDSIGVLDYHYFEESGPAQGWLTFPFKEKTIWINTNSPNDSGGWVLSGRQEITASAPLLLIDDTLEAQNLPLIETP